METAQTEDDARTTDGRTDGQPERKGERPRRASERASAERGGQGRRGAVVVGRLRHGGEGNRGEQPTDANEGSLHAHYASLPKRAKVTPRLTLCVYVGHVGAACRVLLQGLQWNEQAADDGGAAAKA